MDGLKDDELASMLEVDLVTGWPLDARAERNQKDMLCSQRDVVLFICPLIQKQSPDNPLAFGIQERQRRHLKKQKQTKAPDDNGNSSGGPAVGCILD